VASGVIGFPRTINEKAARVVTGVVAITALAPRPGAPKEVAGPPKRFAQGIGAAVTTAAVVALALGASGAVELLLVLIAVAAVLESALAFCVGCQISALLMRAGVIPASICAECGYIWARRAPG
jgi:hypothetical protein